jgi:predicted MFS family arabinose efflux permease
VVRNTVIPRPDSEAGLGGARGGLFILALAAFASVTTEMLPVGLLPAIGKAFGVGASTTGLLVSLYALMVAALAIPLTLATRRVPGKRLLLAAMGCYAVSNLIAATAPSFGVLAAGRAVGGATHALFFSVVIGYATRLVPPAQMGRALAFSSAGVSAGFILGVPLATALGNAVGWRAAFAALTALTVLASALIAMLPDVRPQPGERRAATGRRRQMTAVIGSNTLAFLGHYTLYTYVSVLLLRSGAGASAVGPILLVFGVFGLIGVMTAGPRLDRHPRSSALVILALLAAGILAAGASYRVLALVIVAGAIWNGAFGPAPSMFQAAAVGTGSTSPELAGAWINGTCNIGIAGGAALGGVILGGAGLRDVAWVAAALVVVSVLIAGFARSAFPARRERLPVLVRSPVTLQALRRRALVFRQQPHDLLADLVRVRARAEQDPPGDAVGLVEQAQQDVLRPDVAVAELPGRRQRPLQHRLGARRERDVPVRRPLAPADQLLDLLAERLQADPQRVERLRAHPLALGDQAQQDVLGPDVVVVEAPGLVLRQHDNPPRPVGESLEHCRHRRISR